MEIEKIKTEGKNIELEMKKRIVGYITAAFGLVAGLAWNEAIKAMIEYFFPLDRGSVLAKFVYAMGITLVLVLVSVYLAKLALKKENKE